MHHTQPPRQLSLSPPTLTPPPPPGKHTTRSEAAEVLDPTIALQEAINQAGGKRSKTESRPRAVRSGASKKGSVMFKEEGSSSPRAAGLIRAGRLAEGDAAGAAGKQPPATTLVPPTRTAALPSLAPPPPSGSVVARHVSKPPHHQQQAAQPAAAQLHVEAHDPHAAAAEQAAEETSQQQQPVLKQEHPAVQPIVDEQQVAVAEPALVDKGDRGQPAEQQHCDGDDKVQDTSSADAQQCKDEEAAVAAQGAIDEGVAGGSSAPPAAHPNAAEPPADLICPITGEVFHDPVRAADGRCYEGEAIEVCGGRF